MPFSYMFYLTMAKWITHIHLTRKASWRRQWHPTPVLLPGKSHGWRSLVGCSPWGREESDKTERLHFHFSPSCIGEGNGKALQRSCLENPRDGGAWWAAVYGVAQSRTRLKWLSSSRKARILCEISEITIFHSVDKWKKVAVAGRINRSLLTGKKKRTCDYNIFLVFNLFSIKYIIPNLFLFGINFTNWSHPIVWLFIWLGKRRPGKLIAIAKSMMYSGGYLFPPLQRMEIRVYV